jgi:multidrug efflux system membrane fusion protein
MLPEEAANSPDTLHGQPHIGRDHQLPEPHEGGSRTLKAVIWLAVLLIFAAAFYWIYTHKSTPATPAGGRRGAAGGTVTLTAATAASGDIGVYVDAIGTVTPVYTDNITSQVSGPVVAVHYTEGQLVSKGTPLIDIDPRPFQATLMQAQGTLERDQNMLAQAQMDLERYRAAWAKNAIPKQQLDDQEKLVLQDQGTVKLDQGTVNYDQLQVEYCHITSPISGKVGLRLVDPGNLVTANGTTPLVVVTQMQPITVIFTVPEDSLSEIMPQLHQKARLTVDVLDRTDQKQIASGTLLTLDNQIDTTTGTVKARASFTNNGNTLYPNEFVNAELLVKTVQNATLIPTAAIQHNGTAAFVYVLKDDVAHQTAIQTGVSNKGKTEVSGINPGDMVATSSFDKLQNNAKVAVSTKPVPASTSGSNAP